MPDGLSEAEKAEAVGDALKKGLIKKVVSLAESPAERAAAAARAAGAAAAAAGREPVMEIHRAPSSVQMLVQSVGAATSGNGVSPGRFGPCMINHVQAFTYADGGATNAPQRFGVNISREKNVGPFVGDMIVFEYFDPQDIFGLGQGQGEIFYKQRVDTAVGSRVYPLADFYPHIIIPFTSFYVNVSVGNLNHPATVFVTVEFAPLSVPRGSIVAQPSYSEVRSVAPAVEPARALVPTAEVRRFNNYQEIKVFEALGNKIVWATIRTDPTRTGFPPISVTVVTKK